MFPSKTIFKVGEITGFTQKMYQMGLFSPTNPSQNFIVTTSALLMILGVIFLLVLLFSVWVMWDAGRPIKKSK